MKLNFENIRTDFGSSSMSNLIALFALVISIIAGVFSYRVYKESQKEEISITTERIQDGYYVEIDTTNLNLVTIPTLWECMITNNGKQTVSLIDKKIKFINSDGNIIYYSGIDLGLIKDNRYFSFPINISPGESEKFYIKIGVLMNSSATSSLIKNAKQLTNLTPRKIQYYLAMDSIDIFGNKVKSELENNSVIMFSLPSRYQQAKYIIDFKTGRGNSVIAISSWYPDFNLEK